jgi:hypothetical protein
MVDFDDFQAWCAERERWRGAHARLLRALVDRLEAQPQEAVGFARELVRVSPQDEAARATLLRLLLATGRRDEAEAHYRIGKKQIDREGRGTGELHAAWRQAHAAAPVRPASRPFGQPQQVVRFCTAPDGVRLAHATVGQAAPRKAPTGSATSSTTGRAPSGATWPRSGGGAHFGALRPAG